MVSKNENPNHKIEHCPNDESDNNKLFENEFCVVDNSRLTNQDLNENFLNLRKELIFYKDKSNYDEIKSNLQNQTEFLKIKDEIEPDDIKSKGLDFVILADVSESMYPYRIYLKKSMYFALKDIENFVYRSIEDAEEFPNIRLAFVKYTDRESSSEPGKVEVLDFVEYNSLEEICKCIDEIDIKQFSMKKRSVFDGYKAVSDLNWNEDSIKIIIHYAADPQYGLQYTTSPKKMGDDYDPFPDGVEDLTKEDVLSPMEEKGIMFNFVSLGPRLLRYQQDISADLTMDLIAPKVVELN